MNYIKCPKCGGHFDQRSWNPWDFEDNPNPKCMSCGFIVTTEADKENLRQNILLCQETISKSGVGELDLSDSGMGRLMRYIDFIFAMNKAFQEQLVNFIERDKLIKKNDPRVCSDPGKVDTKYLLVSLMRAAYGKCDTGEIPGYEIQDPPPGCGLIDKYLLLIASRTEALLVNYSKFIDQGDGKYLVRSGNNVDEIMVFQEKLFLEINKVVEAIKKIP